MITLPPRRSAISGMARLHSHRLLLMLELMILSKASSGIFSSGP